MYFILYPLNYLRLRNERGALILWRDVIPVSVITLAVVLFFELVPGANFYGKDGFVERTGGVTSTLTGFYIAGLLAVATFTVTQTALDQPIKVGPVFLGKGDARESLSRREYVCIMFGYLSALSLGYSLFSALAGASAGAIANVVGDSSVIIGRIIVTPHGVIGCGGEIAVVVLVSHIALTTGYGLYYLTKKIYEREPTLGKKR